jgi:hypothetical protein
MRPAKHWNHSNLFGAHASPPTTIDSRIHRARTRGLRGASSKQHRFLLIARKLKLVLGFAQRAGQPSPTTQTYFLRVFNTPSVRPLENVAAWQIRRWPKLLRRNADLVAVAARRQGESCRSSLVGASE